MPESISAKRRTILYVVTEDHYFYSHRLPVARAAKAAGFDIAVAARPSADSSVVEKIKAEGFTFYPLYFNRGSTNPLTESKTLLSLIKLYKKVRPDIVHNVAMQPVVHGSLAAYVTRVPKVINAVAGLGYIFIGRDFKAKILKTFLKPIFTFIFHRKNTTVIVQNPHDAKQLVDLTLAPEKNIRLILGSGVNPTHYPAFADPGGSVVKAALVSRMIWTKGVGEFIEAAKILKERKANVEMLLVGDPDPKNSHPISEQQLKDWQTQGLVTWTGPVKDIVKLWRDTHIAVLPSYREGLPKSLLEAASCARPIVTFDVPGCNTIGVHGENALLVPFKDSNGLADAIEKLANDQNLREIMGQKGRKLVEDRFSSDYVARETLKLYFEN